MNKISSKDRQILTNIIKAQVASDAGKGFTEPYQKFKYGKSYPLYWGYGSKSLYINRAIEGILRCKNSIVRFSAERVPDQNGYPSIIVYFEYTIDGKEMQISFHTPYEQADGLMLSCSSNSAKRRKTSWNHKYGGSRDDVITTARYLGML